MGAMHNTVTDALNTAQIANALRLGTSLSDPIQEKLGCVAVIADLEFARSGSLACFVAAKTANLIWRCCHSCRQAAKCQRRPDCLERLDLDRFSATISNFNELLPLFRGKMFMLMNYTNV